MPVSSWMDFKITYHHHRSPRFIICVPVFKGHLDKAKQKIDLFCTNIFFQVGKKVFRLNIFWCLKTTCLKLFSVSYFVWLFDCLLNLKLAFFFNFHKSLSHLLLHRSMILLAINYASISPDCCKHLDFYHLASTNYIQKSPFE